MNIPGAVLIPLAGRADVLLPQSLVVSLKSAQRLTGNLVEDLLGIPLRRQLYNPLLHRVIIHASFPLLLFSGFQSRTARNEHRTHNVVLQVNQLFKAFSLSFLLRAENTCRCNHRGKKTGRSFKAFSM